MANTSLFVKMADERRDGVEHSALVFFFMVLAVHCQLLAWKSSRMCGLDTHLAVWLVSVQKVFGHGAHGVRALSVVRHAAHNAWLNGRRPS
jgi:hypothetical protein